MTSGILDASLLSMACCSFASKCPFVQYRHRYRILLIQPILQQPKRRRKPTRSKISFFNLNGSFVLPPLTQIHHSFTMITKRFPFLLLSFTLLLPAVASRDVTRNLRQGRKLTNTASPTESPTTSPPTPFICQTNITSELADTTPIDGAGTKLNETVTCDVGLNKYNNHLAVYDTHPNKVNRTIRNYCEPGTQ